MLAAPRRRLMSAQTTKSNVLGKPYGSPRIGISTPLKRLRHRCRHQKRGEYDAVTKGDKFAALLTTHLRDVSHDKHLRVDFSPATQPDVARISVMSGLARRTARDSSGRTPRSRASVSARSPHLCSRHPARSPRARRTTPWIVIRWRGCGGAALPSAALSPCVHPETWPPVCRPSRLIRRSPV
jgi:hypothetical protein